MFYLSFSMARGGSCNQARPVKHSTDSLEQETHLPRKSSESISLSNASNLISWMLCPFTTTCLKVREANICQKNYFRQIKAQIINNNLKQLTSYISFHVGFRFSLITWLLNATSPTLILTQGSLLPFTIPPIRLSFATRFWASSR